MGWSFTSSEPEIVDSPSGTTISFWNCALRTWFADGLGPSPRVSQSIASCSGYVEFSTERHKLDQLQKIQGMQAVPIEKRGLIQFYPNSGSKDWQIGCTYICEPKQLLRLESSSLHLLASANHLALTFSFEFIGFPTNDSLPGNPNSNDFEKGLPIWVSEFTQSLHREIK